MEADFATIRDGLRRLRESTSPLKVFGSEAHGFRTHPPLSEKAVPRKDTHCIRHP